MAGRVQGLPSHDRWLLPYADFVTLLLAVFIVLFSTLWHSKRTITTVSTEIQSGFDALSIDPPQREKPGSEGVPGIKLQEAEGASKMAPRSFDSTKLGLQLRSVLGDAISKRQIVIQQTPDGLVISLRELGFFNSGAATLLPGAAEKLRRTAEVLMQNGLDVRVEGHSDDQPIHTAIFQSNWELSTARAMSVLSLLLEQTDFPPSKISVAGYGPYHPIADNTTQEGRRANRRVDLVVLAPKSSEERLR